MRPAKHAVGVWITKAFTAWRKVKAYKTSKCAKACIRSIQSLSGAPG